MGRPIGSMNREKPFNDALRIVPPRPTHFGFAGLRTNWPYWRRKAISRPSGSLPIAWTASRSKSSIVVMQPIEELNPTQNFT